MPENNRGLILAIIIIVIIIAVIYWYEEQTFSFLGFPIRWPFVIENPILGVLK